MKELDAIKAKHDRLAAEHPGELPPGVIRMESGDPTTGFEEAPCRQRRDPLDEARALVDRRSELEATRRAAHEVFAKAVGPQRVLDARERLADADDALEDDRSDLGSAAPRLLAALCDELDRLRPLGALAKRVGDAHRAGEAAEAELARLREPYRTSTPRVTVLAPLLTEAGPALVAASAARDRADHERTEAERALLALARGSV